MATFSEPKSDVDVLNDADVLTTLLLSTPSLRAKFFANPTGEVANSLPPAKSWDYSRPAWAWLPWYWPGSPVRYRQERKRLAKAVLMNIEAQVGDLKIKASVNTDSVFEEYFAPVIKVSQRSFAAVYGLSIATFTAGVALIAVGAYIGIASPQGTNSTFVASVFGGSGAISALGSVYTVATSGIRDAMADLARVRVVMTAFATQLGQLRAIIENGLTPEEIAVAATTASTINGEIGAALIAAITGLPSSAANAT